METSKPSPLKFAGGRGKQGQRNGDVISLADFLQLLDPTKKPHNSLRGRYFSCSVKSEGSLNTDKFSSSIFMSWIFPLIWLSPGFNCLDAAQLIIHTGREKKEENQEHHGEL